MICFKMHYIENNCNNICHSPSGEEEEASDAEEVKDQETQVPQEAQQEMPQAAMDTEDKDAAPAEVRPAEAAPPSTSGACATVAEPKAVSEVKKRAAALDSTSDSGHASDGTDHGHADGNNAANGANKNRRDDAISTRGDGLERVAYKIGDLGHVAPVTSSGANPEVGPHLHIFI